MLERSVLIIEDDEDTRYMYGAVLSSEGYKVIEAENAAKAITLLENKTWVDLILLDLTLPGMTPLEFVERKNKLHDSAAIPILTISGRTDIAEASAKVGAVDSLRKPFDLDQLIFKVKHSILLLGSNLTH